MLLYSILIRIWSGELGNHSTSLFRTCSECLVSGGLGTPHFGCTSHWSSQTQGGTVSIPVCKVKKLSRDEVIELKSHSSCRADELLLYPQDQEPGWGGVGWGGVGAGLWMKPRTDRWTFSFCMCGAAQKEGGGYPQKRWDWSVYGPSQ